MPKAKHIAYVDKKEQKLKGNEKIIIKQNKTKHPNFGEVRCDQRRSQQIPSTFLTITTLRWKRERKKNYTQNALTHSTQFT